jgi:hypothetical protein
MKEFNNEGNALINHLRLYADTKEPVKLLDQFNMSTLRIIASVSNLPLNLSSNPY